MEFKRSIEGTILFSILALLHIGVVINVIRLFLSPIKIVWSTMSFRIYLCLKFFIYLTLIFVPLGSRIARWIVALFFLVGFAGGCYAFYLYWKVLNAFELGVLIITVLDLLITVALVLQPTNKINRVTPFYAEQGPIFLINPVARDLQKKNTWHLSSLVGILIGFVLAASS